MIRDLRRLERERFDLLIIGGGIVGCGIARDAALRGLRVALVEQEDFAAGASGKSSKLAHGGLRYLEHGQVALVRESCRERELLLKLAPHLVRSLPFLLPYEPGGGWPRLWMLRLGLKLYDSFSGPTRTGSHRMLTVAEMTRQEPSLAGRPLTGGAMYYDAQMDDARLTMEVALGAAEAGAVLVNHAEVVQFDTATNGKINRAVVRDRLTGQEYEVAADLTVNASGPWGDRVLRLAGWEGRPALRPSKGVHLVYSESLTTHAMLLRTRRDRRVFLILPWNGLTLIGTTDTDYPGDPGAVRTTQEDVKYLLEAAAAALPAAHLTQEKILSTFAGVRPLLNNEAGHPSTASREHAITESVPGLLSVLGGKFTTFRAIAEQAVDRIQERLGRPRTPCRTAELPLPGAVPSAPSGPPPPTPAWPRLLGFYGVRADAVVAHGRTMPDGLEPLCPHTWHVKAEVLHAVREEMAVTLEDILDRRLGLAHTTLCRAADAADIAARLAAPLLNWNEAERNNQVERYRAQVARP